MDDTQRSLNIGLFINGLPVFTSELKNSLTTQRCNDAILQYKRDRNPRGPLFQFGRCKAHFAVGENDVYFCTHPKGNGSWFLPFNRGCQRGVGNPPNPVGLRSEYVWRDTPIWASMSNGLENCVQEVQPKKAKTGNKKRVQIRPTYWELDVVRRLLRDAGTHGAGKRYLVQDSAGRGDANPGLSAADGSDLLTAGKTRLRSTR